MWDGGQLMSGRLIGVRGRTRFSAAAAAERAALPVPERTQTGRIDGPPARHSAADSVRPTNTGASDVVPKVSLWQTLSTRIDGVAAARPRHTDGR